jgi:glycosyltransferase involved in cell wall biosynthesis
MTPRIDIAIPCYNYGRYLGACLDSVLSQSVRRLRVLVIDNASTDNSLAVARRYAARDGRVAVLARPANLGPHASFNAGVDWASSDYFMILCADDVLAPGALRGMMDALDAAPGAAFAIGADAEWRTGEPKPPASPAPGVEDWKSHEGAAYLGRRCREPMRNLAAGMVLVRTAAQKGVGRFRSELRYCDDHEILLRLADVGGVLETPRIVGFRRIHATNMSLRFSTGRLEELEHRREAFESFFAREGGSRPDCAELRRTAEGAFATQAYWWGVRAAVSGSFREARALLAWAFARDPAILLFPPLGHLFRANGRLRRLLHGAGLPIATGRMPTR